MSDQVNTSKLESVQACLTGKLTIQEGWFSQQIKGVYRLIYWSFEGELETWKENWLSGLFLYYFHFFTLLNKGIVK